jgi:hypothetical protein
VGVLVAALLAVGLAVPSAPPAHAIFDEPLTPEDIADLATYRVNTTLELPGVPAVTKTTDAVMTFDNFIDVNVPADGVADLRVNVQPDQAAGQIALGVQRLTAGPPPLRVEFEFDLPGPTDQVVILGYDSTDGAAPTGFLANAIFSGQSDHTTIHLDVGAANPVAPFSLVGSIFGRNGTTRIDPLDARVSFANPSNVLSVTFDSQPSAGHTHVDVASSFATKTTVDVSDVKGGRSRNLHAVVDALPSTASVDVVDDGAGHTTIGYAGGAAVNRLDLALHQQVGLVATDVNATLTKLATQATLELVAGNPAAGGSQEAHYTASGPVNTVDATASVTVGGGVAAQAVVHASGLPTTVDLVRNAAGQLSMSASAPVTRVEAGLAAGRSVELLHETGHYLNAITGADGSISVAAQVLGLKSFSATLGDPLTVAGSVNAAPLHAHAVDPARAIDITTSNVSPFSVSLSPSDGTLTYHAKTGINSIHATLDTTAPFVGAARHGELTLTTVPKDLDLEFGLLTAARAVATAVPRSQCVPTPTEDCPDPEPPPGDDDPNPPPPATDQDLDVRVGLDAHGATIGRIDTLLTSGGLPANALAATEDGVVFERTATVFRLQGRLSGLRSAAAHVQVVDDANTPLHRITRSGDFQLHLDPTVVQTRTARLQFSSGGNTGRLSLSRLPADIEDLSFVDLAQAETVGIAERSTQTVNYDASSTIASASVALDLGSMPNPLTASLTNVPAHFDFCKSTDGVCNDEPGVDRPRDHGSFLFDASSPVTLSGFLCLAPDDGTCTSATGADSALTFQNVALRHFAYELNVGAFTAANPFSAVLDTDGFGVTGDIEFFAENEADVDLQFPGNSFAGNDDHSGGIDIKNSPALNTTGFQVTAWKSGIATVNIAIAGHVACNANTTWQLITPTILFPNPFVTSNVCG